MANPTVNDVHVDSIAQAGQPKQKRLSMTELKAVLARLLTMMDGDEPDEVVKAYKSEHAARQLDPDQHKVIGSKEIMPGIRLLFAIVDGKTVVQSVRFNSEKYSEDKAKQWLTEHKYKTSTFEAAVAKAHTPGLDPAIYPEGMVSIHTYKMPRDHFVPKVRFVTDVEAAVEEIRDKVDDDPFPTDAIGAYVEEKQSRRGSDGYIIVQSGLSVEEEKLTLYEEYGHHFDRTMGDERETAFSTDNKIVVKLLETANKHHRAGPVWRREKPPYEFTADALVKFWTATDIAKFAHEWPEHWELVQVMGKELGWKLPVVDAPVEKDDDSTVILDVDASILKADNEEQTITYVVYPAKPLPWCDSQQDRMSDVEIRKACHRYMEQSQRFDLHHTEFNLSKQDISVVQNWQSPIAFAWPLPDGSTKQINAGDWVQTAHVTNPDLWQRIKKGEFRAPSIRGKGKRTPVSVNSQNSL
jgi:hypothetical protein